MSTSRALQSVKRNLGIPFMARLHHVCAKLGNEGNLASFPAELRLALRQE